MGGAFIALADDATSAYSNPAGLIQARAAGGLARVPRLGLRRDCDRPRPRVRAADRNRPRHGSGRRLRGFPSSTSGVSSRRFVYPKTRWALGLFAHPLPEVRDDEGHPGRVLQLQRRHARHTTPSPICQALVAETNGIDRRAAEGAGDQDRALERRQRRCRSSWARPVARRLRPLLLVLDRQHQPGYSTFAPRPRSGRRNPQGSTCVSTQKGDDQAFALERRLPLELRIVGAGRRLSQRAELRLHQHGHGPGGAPRRMSPGPGCAACETVRFKVPDTFAAGLAFRPVPPLTLSFQYDFVEFTDLLGPQSSGLPPNAGRHGRLRTEGRRRPALPLRRRVPEGVLGRAGAVAARRGLVRQRPPRLLRRRPEHGPALSAVRDAVPQGRGPDARQRRHRASCCSRTSRSTRRSTSRTSTRRSRSRRSGSSSDGDRSSTRLEAMLTAALLLVGAAPLGAGRAAETDPACRSLPPRARR